MPIALAALSTTANATTPQCQPFIDASIISEDGKFLGKLTNKFDPDSIFNKYGDYGSKYSTESIWNKYGDYGSLYGANSAFNPYSSDPPMIVKNKQIIALLSKNKNARGAVDPVILAAICFDFTPE